MSLLDVLAPADEESGKPTKYYGVVTGLVRDIKDPKRLGRVKVDFPWLAEEADAVAEGQEDRAHSAWARVATLMASKNRGMYFLPDVGDEVLVAFEHGDPERPVVLGGLWNADDEPPHQMDAEGKNNVRAIYSRSGHAITLDDSDDKAAISIVDKTGENSIVIDSANNAMALKVKGDLTIDVGGNITLKVKGNINIDAEQAIEAKAKTGLTLKTDSAGNVTIEAGQALEARGKTGLTLKSDTIGSLEASASLTVKGGLVQIN